MRQLAAGLACLVLGACTASPSLPFGNKSPGTFEVEFRWGVEKPAPNPSIYVFGFVVNCQDVDDQACLDARSERQLGVAGPTPYTADPELTFSAIKNGKDRVVLLEFRQGNSLDAPVLYAGRSGRFTLEAGSHTVVPVDLGIAATPSAPSQVPSQLLVVPDVTIPAGQAAEGAYVKAARVTLHLFTPGAGRVRVSNDPSLPASEATRLFTLAEQTPVTTAVPTGLVGAAIPWDLEGGCAAPSGCVRRVYARYVDERGYASPLLTAEIVLDATGPSVTDASGPGQSHFSSLEEVTYAVGFNEPVNAATALLTAVGSGSAAGSEIVFGPAQPSPLGTSLGFTATTMGMPLDGPYTVSITAFDVVGNPVGAAVLPGFTLDTHAPDITNIALVDAGDGVFKRDARFGVSFTVDEDVVAAHVRVGGVAAQRLSGSGAGMWAFEYVVGPSDGAGIKPVVITALDLAGNQSAVLAPSVRFDFEGPSLTFAVVPDGRAARLGEVLAVTVASNEPLAAGIQLNLAGLALSGPVASGTTYVWSGAVPANTEATYQLTAAALDLAGNASGTVGPVAVTVDGRPPQALNLEVDPPRVRAGEVFLLRFTASEDLSSTPVATFSNGTTTRAMALRSVQGRDYVMEGTAPMLVGAPADGGVAEDAGVQAGTPFYSVVLTLVDVPGNVASIHTPQPVEIDNVPPVAVLQVSPPAARRDDEVRVILSANEVLGRAPRDQEDGMDPPRIRARHTSSNAVLEFTLLEAETPDQEGITFTYRAVMGAGDEDGTYQVLPVDVVDQAGNSSVLNPVAATLVVDVGSPALSSIGTSRGVYSAVAPFNVFQLDFDAGERLATLAVALGGQDLVARSGQPCQETLGTLVHYRCSYTLVAQDALDLPSGLHEVRITARDAAGNTTFDGTSVSLDFQPPSLLSDPVVTPALAKIDDDLTYAIAVSEELQGNTPQLTMEGPAPLQLSLQPGTRYAFRHRVVEAGMPGGDVHGTYQPVFTLVDVVGNSTVVRPSVRVVLDATRPTLDAPITVSPVVNGQARASFVSATKNTGHITFNWSESLPIADHVKAHLTDGTGSVEMACAAGAGVDVDCSYRVKQVDTHGVRELELSVSDAAGNVATTSRTFLIDQRAPDVVAKDISPVNAVTGTALFKRGDTVVVNLALDETDARTGGPVLQVTGPAGSNVVMTALANSRYTFQHVVGASDVVGAYSLAVQMQDGVDNTRTVALTTLGFTLDPVPPLISNLVYTRSRVSHVTGFDQVRVVFDVSDDRPLGLAPVPVLTVAGAAGTCVAIAAAGTTPVGGIRYQCTYSVPANATDERGQDSIITVQDEAGNTTQDAAVVRFDFSAPQLASTGVTPAVARLGDTVVVNLSLDEAEGSTPTLVLTPTSGQTGAVPAFTYTAGTSFLYTHLVAAGDVSGDYDLDAQVLDVVGNSTRRNGGTSFKFSLDAAPPAISNPTINAQKVSRVAPFNVVRVEFDLTDNRPLTGVLIPSMTVGGANAPCALTMGAAHYTCTYTLTGASLDTEGAKAVILTAQDVAGNQVQWLSLVQFDFTAPTVSFAAAGPAVAGLGDKLILSMELNETAGATPVLTLTRAGGAAANPPAFSHVTGTTFVWTHDVTAVDSSGTYDVDASVVDSVGNQALRTGPVEFAFKLDSVPPVISAVAFNGVIPEAGQPPRFSRKPGFSSTEVTFTLSEVVTAAPVLQVGVAAPVACAANGSNTLWKCTRAVAAADVEGPKDATLSVVDDAGNQVSLTATVIFDFTAPNTVGRATHAYVRAANNPRAVVTAATLGTTVQVLFDVTESLGADPVVTPPANSGLVFAKDPTSTASSYVYAATLTAIPGVQGQVAAGLTLLDLVGNSRTVTLNGAGESFKLDTVAPAAADTSAGKILYTRFPSGQSSTGGLPKFTVAAADGSVEPSAQVQVFSGPSATTADVLGFRSANGAGGVGVFNLLPVDVPVVWLGVVDDAGNISPLVDVKDVSWRMSIGGKVAGQLTPNPSVVTRRTWFSGAREQGDAVELGASSGMDIKDEGATVTTSLGGRFVRLAGWEQPAARVGPAAAYDGTRGVVVVFGGRSSVSGTQYLDDTWEWNGSGWTLVRVLDPEGDGSPGAREGASLVHDSATGTLLLFGGVSNDGANHFYNDTWEYDGSSWRLLATTGPGCRAYAGGAYDEAVRRVMVFGGWASTNCTGAGVDKADTWTWDGAAWTNVTPAAGSPSARRGPAMAAFTSSGKVILFGGSASGTVQQDTYEWNGTAWSVVAAVGTPPARANAGFISPLGAIGNSTRMVMMGGTTGAAWLADAWTFDGTTWTAAAASDPEVDGNPAARDAAALVWDAARGQGVLAFGRTGASSVSAETWRMGLSGAAGAPALAAAVAGPQDPQADGNPAARYGAALTYDSRTTRKRAVLFGGRTSSGSCEGDGAGNCGEAWEWDGASWVKRAAADAAGVVAPLPRHLASMVFDDRMNRAFLFGGTNGTTVLGDTWTWNGTAWATIAGAGPQARHSFAMAHDTARQKTVLFGGRSNASCDGNGNPTCGGTWLFDSATQAWSQASPASPPAARRGHAMALDAARGVVVLFGGATNAGTILGDTWEWNGATGTWAVKTPATVPPARACHALTYDKGRGRVVLQGGSTSDPVCTAGTNALMDAWEWDGTNWRELVSTTVRASDPEGDALPVARASMAVAYDDVHNHLLMVGGLVGGGLTCDGSGGGSACGWNWGLDLGATDRPALVYTVPLAASGEDFHSVNAPVLTNVVVEWKGGGSGNNSGVLGDGTALWMWSHGRFLQMDTNGASPTNLSAFIFNAALNAPNVPRLSFLSGREDFITTALSPRYLTGKVAGGSTLTVDYVDMQVDYRRQ